MPASDPEASPRPPAPARHRFFSPRAQAWCLTALAVAVGVAVAVPALVSNPARIARLAARAVPGLQADVSIGGARIGWAGPVVIEDVRIVPHSGARPPLSIKRIEGSHGLAAILLSFGDLGRVRVEGLEADVVFNADRTSNLTGLVSAGGSLPSERGERGRRSSPVRMRIAVEDAVATLTGPWAPDPWVSDPTDIEVSLGPASEGGGSVWTVEKVQLLREARLAANVAQGVLAYIAPVMADAARTSGRFSLRIDGATFPVGAPEAARLAGVLSMHEVDMGPGPLVAKMLDSLPGRLELPRSIRVADDADVEFVLADRRVWHRGLQFGIPLAKPGQRLDIHSSGSVGLDDKTLDLKFALPIPADLPADRPLLAALAGKSISIGIGGVLGEPRVDFDGSIRATAGEVVGDLVDRLRNPGQPVRRPPDPPRRVRDRREGDPTDPVDPTPPAGPAGSGDPTPQPNAGQPAGVGGEPTADAIIDLVGGVLEEVARRRAERAAANADNPQGPPPPGPRRGGRLLRRAAPPPADQAPRAAP